MIILWILWLWSPQYNVQYNVVYYMNFYNEGG